MAFISTIAEESAPEAVRAIYNKARERFGYLPNMTLLFGHRPEVAEAWGKLIQTIQEGELDPRRYILTTMAAAGALRSSYCMLAHGKALAERFYEKEEVTAIARNFRSADLDPADIAMMDFAEKIANDATSITGADVENLRQHGFSDPEIFDISAVAAARCFYSKLLDALGVQPDEQYLDLESEVREALTVGRPINDS